MPVKSKNHFNILISEAQIIEDGWRKKHLKTLKMNYIPLRKIIDQQLELKIKRLFTNNLTIK